MLQTEKIGCIFTEIRIEKKITLYRENVEFCDVKPGGKHSNCHGWFQASAEMTIRSSLSWALIGILSLDSL